MALDTRYCAGNPEKFASQTDGLERAGNKFTYPVMHTDCHIQVSANNQGDPRHAQLLHALSGR